MALIMIQSCLQDHTSGRSDREVHQHDTAYVGTPLKTEAYKHG
jgi:hypothetical protein